MADTWRYRFYQMQNGLPGFTSESHLFDLPINSAKFDIKLNDVGQLNGTLDLADLGVQNALAGQTTLDLLCEKTAVYVDLNGNLVWGGRLLQSDYDSSTRLAKIQCQDWWGYFYNNRNIVWNSNYTSQDQLYIAADLINSAQGAPVSAGGYTPGFTGIVGGNVGVLLGVTPTGALGGTVTSGIQLTQSWQPVAGKSLGQAIRDMGTAANGYDFTVDVAYDANGNPTKTFNLWYPRAGTAYQTQLSNGGKVVTFFHAGSSGHKYRWPTGQDKPANSFLGTGAGGSSIQAFVSDPNLLSIGYPLLEDNVSYADVVQQNLLTQVTTSVLQQRKYPVRLPWMQYEAGSASDQGLGSWAIGDDCRIIIEDDAYFPSGYDSARGNAGENYWRNTQISTVVNDEGKSWMELTFVLPPS